MNMYMYNQQNIHVYSAKIDIYIFGESIEIVRLQSPLRLRVLKCYVWSTLLYGSETWTLSSDVMRQLEATEMWGFMQNVKDIV